MTGEERRRQLIKVAIRLFSQKGFTGTTTKEIALAANVNEALIFRYFATKDDLYAAILDDKASELCVGDWLGDFEEYAKRSDDEGLFRALAQKKLDHFRRDQSHTFLRLMFYSSLEGHGLAKAFLERQAGPVHDFMCGYIKRRQREGAFRDAHPEAVVGAFIGMLNHYIITNAFFDCWKMGISDEEVVVEYTRLLLDGLRTLPAVRMRRTSRVIPPASSKKTIKGSNKPEKRKLKL
ncbi:MAG: TetR/AcrR family transcriptional regulator [Pyrinomonadaceae bacterium]